MKRREPWSNAEEDDQPPPQLRAPLHRRREIDPEKDAESDAEKLVNEFCEELARM